MTRYAAGIREIRKMGWAQDRPPFFLLFLQVEV